MQFDPWVEKIWRRKWQPAPVFLPGECHGQRSLAGYSPWGRKRVGHNCAPRLGGARKGQVEGEGRGKVARRGRRSRTGSAHCLRQILESWEERKGNLTL